MKKIITLLNLFCITLIMSSIDADLIASYTFNGNANDTSGNANHATVTLYGKLIN